jgi:predicted RNA binding protein with dsRBD fold (UPF0201 family)
MRYSLNDFNETIFNGFNYELPGETLKIISELSLEVGSPNYVKTPIFQKRENPMKVEPLLSNIKEANGFKKKRNTKNMEVFNDEDWDTLRTFQTTKIEEKIGIEGIIDNIRSILNKLTDKNYGDMLAKVFAVLDTIILDNNSSDEISKVSFTIFEIASTNRYYSKIYADLYSDIITKYDMMKGEVEKSLSKIMDLFTTIEYIDSKVDYDKFCEINKTNEKRKALCSFFVNLSLNGIIPNKTITNITRNLLNQIYSFISQEDKKNEADELTENVALLYKKELYCGERDYELIDGHTIIEIIEKIAHSKVKDYKSLTNKTIFKFMDMIDM